MTPAGERVIQGQAMANVRVGVVGVGYLGKFHAEKYARMPGVELAAVADLDARRAAQVAEALGVAWFTDYRRLFGRVDAVSIAVPTSAHGTVGSAFLEQGVDVLIEKPIAATLEEAERLVRLSEARGRILQVGHLERFNPAVAALEGLLRRPMFIESQRLSVFRNRGTDVSVVLDLMIHDIDIIAHLVNSPVRTVRAVGASVVTGQVDIANARLEFQNGAVATATASRVATQDERSMRLFQKGAVIGVDFLRRGISVLRPNGRGADGQASAALQVEERRFAAADALDDELRAFVGAVAARSEPTVSGHAGRRALEIALNIMEQITGGGAARPV